MAKNDHGKCILNHINRAKVKHSGIFIVLLLYDIVSLFYK